MFRSERSHHESNNQEVNRVGNQAMAAGVSPTQERAKAELNCMLSTFWGHGNAEENRKAWRELDERVNTFIKDVEDNALQE